MRGDGKPEIGSKGILEGIPFVVTGLTFVRGQWVPICMYQIGKLSPAQAAVLLQRSAALRAADRARRQIDWTPADP